MAKINTRPSTDAFEGGDINFKRPSQAKGREPVKLQGKYIHKYNADNKAWYGR